MSQTGRLCRDPSRQGDTSDDRGHYRTLFEDALDATAIIDPVTGSLYEVNDQFCAMHGDGESELSEMGVGALTASDWTAEGTLVERIRQVFADGTGTDISLYLVNTLVDQYGGSVWVDDGEPQGCRVQYRT